MIILVSDNRVDLLKSFNAISILNWDEKTRVGYNIW